MRKVRSYKSAIIPIRKCVDDRHWMKVVDQRAAISGANDDSLYIYRSSVMILT
ncbi:Uncharacterised protein [Serratia proteamaculans]|nr:Uncharacterised protein [Serratia proteamaculans]CAI1620511.1 Uncharacterised protein [Serratia proteamaculans]CAI1663702.1 Uncharacterised protein [Serratia proteamaculans]CAI1703455.1 Uncharacterised protein [Serratia proteamaculans]CAI1715428.1 Uncharacterised protein [Serratia proteamaculans]